MIDIKSGLHELHSRLRAIAVALLTVYVLSACSEPVQILGAEPTLQPVSFSELPTESEPGRGSAPVEVGAESVDVGSASVDVGSASVDVGSASVDVGSASVDVESASVDVESASVVVGSASVVVGSASDDVESASDDVESASDDVGSASDDVGSASVDVGSASDDVGSASVVPSSSIIAVTSSAAESPPSTDLAPSSFTEPSSFIPEPIVNTENLLKEPIENLFQLDGYDSVDVVRVDLNISSAEGLCGTEDLSGCTLADVNDDTNPRDELTVEIPVHFQGADYSNDGSMSNAELRQRGASSRLYPQKSYRIKLDKGVAQWRNERRLQLNKHPADLSRIRNKLSFDLMKDVPSLPSLRTQFINLWIDEGQGPVDFGLFTHVEAVAEEFLNNRGWNEDDRIYKAETFAFSPNDLAMMALDDTGKPMYKDAFDERLSLKTGVEDHSALINMLTAVNDPAQSFESTLDRYFDKQNVLMWVTVNFLLGQKDVSTHNFYLYNPVGTEKFYFLPWDYDAALYIEVDPPNSFDTKALVARLFYGYARGANSSFLDQYFRLPGINTDIVNAASALRRGALSDSEISKRVTQYSSAVRPFLIRQPDVQHLAADGVDAISAFDSEIRQLAGYVTSNEQTLQRGLGIPIPHTLENPVRADNQVVFSWIPAHDVTGHTISYDIQVATQADFDVSSIVFEYSGIADQPGKVEYSVPEVSLPSGSLYYRVIARPSSDPQRLWQVAKNAMQIDGVFWYGIVQFDL